MRYCLTILALLHITLCIRAQAIDTAYLRALYDRSIDFSEEKLDSFLINADFIEEHSQELGYSSGKILATRLRGLYSDFSGNYDEALRHYLTGLKLSREGHFLEYEISALSDLAIVYTEIKQPLKAKDMYMECLALTARRGEISSIISGYSNIAAIYNILNNTDSALYFLTAARSLCEKYQQYQTIGFVYNNTGNVYFKRKEYDKALTYFRLNKQRHEQESAPLSDFWIDYLNMGDCFIELGQFDSARIYTAKALRLSQELFSKSKEADSYALMSKLHERLGLYKKAYEYQRRWYALDTALVNEHSNRTIAEMQERFHASEKDKQNRLLMAAVQQEKIRNSYLSYLAVAAGIIGLLVGAFLLVYRRANRKLRDTNQVINRQKEKLVTLNQEKNSLLSIVSHDLGSPFASIQMWSQLLEKELGGQPLRALDNIRESALTGERLIRQILEIEKKGTGKEQLELEEIDIGRFLAHIAERHRMIAEGKGIELVYRQEQGSHFLMTDQDLFRRIFDNLLSNAIKFSPEESRVSTHLYHDEAAFFIDVSDEGPGISAEDQARLFSKYGTLTARPTAGESSTGLGLSIVKRLVSELNGSISLVSEPGEGARFTVRFPR